MVALEGEIDFAEDVSGRNELNLQMKFLPVLNSIAIELKRFLKSAYRGSLIR
jgi:hypothetical protein